MAEPSGTAAAPAQPRVEDAVPAFLGRAAAVEAARQPPRPQPQAAPEAPQAAPPAASPPPATAPPELRAEPMPPAERRPAPVGGRSEETVRDMERRLGLRQPEL
jgi:hypothetical protein